MHAIAFEKRLPQTVRVLMELSEDGALRTQEALGEDIISVAPNSRDRTRFDLDCESARRFA